MRKRFVVLGVCLLLTGCGSSGSTSSYTAERNGAGVAVNSYSYESGTLDGAAVATEDGYWGGESDSPLPESARDNSDAGDTLETGVIDTDKLVYRGTLELRTLDYEESVKAFKDKVKEVGGFIENESQWKDGGYSYYYYDDYEDKSEDRRTYTATMRIPSKSFSSVFESVEDIGDVVRSSSNVENITQRYNTTATQLEIYQTKYNRYIKLLANAETVEEMLAIENELTNIEVQLAQYKTAISTMDTDVAYSYIDVTINEVLKRSDLKSKDTFLSRLGEAFEGSWKGILEFLEGVIIFLIYAWWYIAIFVIVLFFIIKRVKKMKKNGKVKFGGSPHSGAYSGSVPINTDKSAETELKVKDSDKEG